LAVTHGSGDSGVLQGEGENALQPVDWIILGGYFVFIIWLGSYFGKKQKSSERYFLGNRRIPGWAVGMSIFATIISSWAFMALPGKSFKNDMQFLLTIAPIPLAVVISSLFIIPLFRNKIKLSAYEYLERRFGPAARFYGDFLFICGHFFKMSMVLYLLCLAISGMTGFDVAVLIFIIGVATIIYTFYGGIEGVVWTEVIQGFLLLGGGVLALYFLLFMTPVGPEEVLQVGFEKSKFKLAEFDFTWQEICVYVLLWSGFNLYMSKYATDQTVVQRYLLSPSTDQARRSLWISVLLLGVVWILFMLIGALLWVYYEIQPGLLPAEVRNIPDKVFAYFIAHELPAGVTGLILAGIFAASMSTLSADLNSLGSVLIDDFYNKLARRSTEEQRLWFSRLSVLVTGLLSIILALFLTRFEEQSMVDGFLIFTAIIAGGMLGMFFLGFFTRRCSKDGLYIGLVVGVAFIIWATLTNPKTGMIESSTLLWFPRFKVNLLWLGLLGNLVVFAVGYAASLIVTPGHKAPEGLTIYGKEELDQPKK